MAYVFMQNVRHVFTQPTAAQVSVNLLTKQINSLERCRCAASQSYFQKGLLSTFQPSKGKLEIDLPYAPQQSNVEEQTIIHQNTNNIKKKYPFYAIRTKDVHLQKFSIAIDKGMYIYRYKYIYTFLFLLPKLICHLSVSQQG